MSFYKATDPSWYAFAACAGLGPDLFFPEMGKSAVEARKVCAKCLVVDECLELSLQLVEDKWGVWGGMTERDRCRLRKQRRVQI